MIASIKKMIKKWYLSNLGTAISEVEFHDLLMNVLLAVYSLNLLITNITPSMKQAGVMRIKSDKIRYYFKTQ